MKYIILLFLTISLVSCALTQSDSTVGYNPKDYYNKQEVTIIMRDGIKLHTTVYSPKDTSKEYPILLYRTPYSCKPYGANEFPSVIGPIRP